MAHSEPGFISLSKDTLVNQTKMPAFVELIF